MAAVGAEESMFHSNTELLIDYWRSRKIDRLSPLRTTVDPSDFSGLLSQVFILGRAAPGQYLFRLAGGLLTDLHKRDLRRVDLLSLLPGADRPRIGQALEQARRTAEPAVLTVDARTEEGLSARIEVLIAPLRAETAPQDRIIGLYQPLTPLAELRGQTVRELAVIRIGAAEDVLERPRLRLAAIDGQRIA
jgi:hypothetical protein